MKKLLTAFLCLSVIFILASCDPSNKKGAAADSAAEAVTAAEETAAEAEVKTEPAQGEVKITPNGTALLKSEDIAFSIDDLKITWQQLYDFLCQNGFRLSRLKLGGEFAQADPLTAEQAGILLLPSDESEILSMTTRIIRNLVLLSEAEKEGITVTEEDIKEYTAKLAETYPGDIKMYLASFPETSDNQLVMTRNKMFTLAKFTDLLLQDITVPDDVIDREIAKQEAEKKLYVDMTNQARLNFQELSLDPRILSDQGFAEMAKEYSEGREASNGGVINQLATREQIADANDGQEFTTMVGQTSPMIETETAFRYIRVLASYPGAKEGDPERLRIAQILYPKINIPPTPERKEIYQQIKYKISESNINYLSEQMLAERQFSCPLFPNLINKLTANQKKDSEAEETGK